MLPTAILWPMLGHVLLVFVVYVVVGARRFGAVRSGGARVSNFRDRSSEPPASATASANLMNQFELPILFHLLCLAFYVTNGASYLTVTLMWLFVISRYVHAAIHLTGNNVLLRARSFAAGLALLGIGWVVFALHLAGLA